MKIIDIRATPVSVPLAAPLRHANGCHWGRFVRTIIEVETDNGLIGLGEMGGGGESAVAAFNALQRRIKSALGNADALSRVLLAHLMGTDSADKLHLGAGDAGRPTPTPHSLQLVPASSHREPGSSTRAAHFDRPIASSPSQV